MHLVIDSNALRSDDLLAFLSHSPHHRAVLCDFAAMEAYKADTLQTIFRSMAILSQFPRQVVVLKPTIKVAGLKGDPKGFVRRMIDHHATREFDSYSKLLPKAEAGNEMLQRQLLSLGTAATANIDRIKREIPMVKPATRAMRTMFTQQELRIIREDTPYTRELVDKCLEIIIDLMTGAIQRHPNPPPALRQPGDMFNLFLFRYATCTTIWALEWIGRGGMDTIRDERLANDGIDLIFTTYATYFDGLLSGDKKANRIYERALMIIKSLSGKTPNLL